MGVGRSSRNGERNSGSPLPNAVWVLRQALVKVTTVGCEESFGKEANEIEGPF